MAALLLTVCGCSDRKPKNALNYEQPALTFACSIKMGDDESYLNCYTDGAKEKYLNGDSYNSSLTDLLQPKKGGGSGLTCKIESSKELENDDLRALEDSYRTAYSRRIAVSKAYILRIAVMSMKNDQMIQDERDLTVVLTDSGWKIFGDVIEQLDFKPVNRSVGK